MALEKLELLLTVNSTQLQREINKTSRTVKKLEADTKKSTFNMLESFKMLANGIESLGIGKMILASVRNGMETIESDNLFGVVMGNQAASIRAWSEELQDKLGLVAYEIHKTVGTIYDLISSMGIADTNAINMSKAITLLAQDMASFYNISSDEAINKLQAGLTGEAKPLKKIGILVNENTIKEVAYRNGIAQTGAQLTEQEKVMARYVAIMEQTSNTHGDLARTINSPANMVRILKQRVANLGIAFGNLLMPTIGAILPYITSFVKIVTMAVNALSKFLGITADSSLSSMAKNFIVASDGAVVLADNAGNAAKKLSKASDKAKDLKNVLAGFAETNIIKEDGSTSSDDAGSLYGGAIGGTGTDFEVGEYDTSWLDNIDSKLDVIVEKIKCLFGEINLQPLIESFSSLQDALMKFTAPIFEPLEYFYQNILKPLGNWEITEDVPNFINLLSSTLEVFIPILESFREVGNWLWENFLGKFASFVGDVVTVFLENLTFALDSLSSWASENQMTIDTLVLSLITFFSLWQLTPIFTFIQMSGFVADSFDLITSKIWLSILAKTADAVITSKLIVLNTINLVEAIAKASAELIINTAKWIVSTVAKNANAIATGIVTAAQIAWNVAATIGSAVTTALGAAFAFLTSPIGLVILAVAAIITIAILLWKNWDIVKEKTSQLGAAMKRVWEDIKKTISDVWTGIKNIVKSGVNFLISQLNSFILGVNKIKIPDWVPAVGGKSLNIPTIPRLSKGGIVNRATLALVGEAGKEAVMPLENNTGWINELAGKLSERGGNGQPIQLTVQIGEDTLIEKLIDGLNDNAFLNNGSKVMI